MLTVTSPSPLERLAGLLGIANENAALTIEALCRESVVLADGVRQSRPHAGQFEVASQIRALVGCSQLADLASEKVPRFVMDRSAPHALGAVIQPDPRAPWSPGARHASPDRYSVHCTPHIHGALLDQLRRARQMTAHDVRECDAATGSQASPNTFGWTSPSTRHRVSITSGCANLKAAIAALSSISERRLAKLLDPAQNHGLPAALVPNPDGNHYGLMVLRYRAAVLVSELSDVATPARSDPKLPQTETPPTCLDDELAHTDKMCEALQSVLALERYAAVQALRIRMTLLARVYGQATAPAPGEFAQQILAQFDRAGLLPIWDGQKRPHEIETVHQLMVGHPGHSMGILRPAVDPAESDLA